MTGEGTDPLPSNYANVSARPLALGVVALVLGAALVSAPSLSAVAPATAGVGGAAE